MKKVFYSTLVLFLLLCSQVRAQFAYDFTTFKRAYQPLVVPSSTGIPGAATAPTT